MSAWYSALPLQRPRVHSDTRPHSVHASSSSSVHSADEQDLTPRASLASLGVLPDATGRRLSRDDTAASMTELLPEAGPSRVSKGESLFQADDHVACEDAQMDSQRHNRSIFRKSSLSSLTSAVSSTSSKSAADRKYSTGYRARFQRIGDGMSRYSGRMRRSSTPQAMSSASHGPKFTPAPVPPTSPSKRNGNHHGDRPFKQRQFIKQSDRKDTPAPPPGWHLARPAIAMSMSGGERARQAAAALNVPAPLNEEMWEGQEDLNRRRSRLGSLSSAADSGADLSTYAGSNTSSKDVDGDIDMLSDEMDVDQTGGARDPLKILPSEIALQIFELLDANDLLQAEAVSRNWQTMSTQMCIWRKCFLDRYQRGVYTNPMPIQVGGLGIGRPNRPNQEWKRMYKARVNLEANWRKGAQGAGKAIYLSGHTDSVYCLQFDEEKIITGSRDRTIRVWDINNFTCKRVIGAPQSRPTVGPKVMRTVDYPDFHLATASVNGTAYGDSIYHTPSEWHSASILCLQYDEEILVTGSSDTDLIVWDIETYEPIKRLERHTGGVLDVALDAKHIVSCSKDSRIIVWDRATYTPKGELTGHRGPVNAVQLRGKYLVSASGDGIARLWDIEEMKLLKEFSAKERGLAAVEFSEDMKYVLAGGNDTITYKFDVQTGKEVMTFPGHSQLVRSLWLDSSNARVVSGSYDLDLRVYDFNTGQEIWRAEEWTTSWMLAAKSDYRRIVATSQDGRILIVDFGLQKCVNPNDGQPYPDVNLLRGLEETSEIVWRDPWEMDRAKEYMRERAERDERSPDPLFMPWQNLVA